MRATGPEADQSCAALVPLFSSRTRSSRNSEQKAANQALWELQKAQEASMNPDAAWERRVDVARSLLADNGHANLSYCDVPGVGNCLYEAAAYSGASAT